MRAQSQQAMLDSFFGSLGASDWSRTVSDRAFAKARERLYMPALAGLNDWVVQRADEVGFVARWCGLRVVAGDGSVLMPAIRPCLRTRSAAAADQRLFALYLPGAELTLHAGVYSAAASERAMLMESLDKLGPEDVLVLDRGYPAAWLVSLLLERGIRFVMRCDNDSGWAAAKRFLRSGDEATQAVLNAPSAEEVRDWGCAASAPGVRLVRNVSTAGRVRVLATNLTPEEVPTARFGELYHQRWRIEEAFKRLKHRLHLEAVSGLTQQALIVDLAAKVLADKPRLAAVRYGNAGGGPAVALAKVQSLVRGADAAAVGAANPAGVRRGLLGGRAGDRDAREGDAARRRRAISASSCASQAACSVCV